MLKKKENFFSRLLLSHLFSIFFSGTNFQKAVCTIFTISFEHFRFSCVNATLLSISSSRKKLLLSNTKENVGLKILIYIYTSTLEGCSASSLYWVNRTFNPNQESCIVSHFSTMSFLLSRFWIFSFFLNI